MQGMFFPRPDTTKWNKSETLLIKGGTSDSTLNCYWHRAWPTPRFTVVHFHGNGELVGDYLRMDKIFSEMKGPLGSTLGLFRKMGCDYLLVEYRGYGHSSGKPSISGLIEDTERVVEALREKGVPPERIVVFGRSMGCIPAAELAGRFQTAGLILESGRHVTIGWDMSYYKKDGFSKEDVAKTETEIFKWEEKMRAYTGSSLILHTQDDKSISVESAKHSFRWLSGEEKIDFEDSDTYKTCKKGKHQLVIFYEYGHNNIFRANEEVYSTACLDFIRDLSRDEKGAIPAEENNTPSRKCSVL